MFSRKEVMDRATENEVKFVQLQFTDIFGALKDITITVEDLERALAGELVFDSTVIEGVVKNREQGIRLLPDPSTFALFPWRAREGQMARLICEVENPDGTPYPGCSRNVLRRVLNEAAQDGLDVQAGCEIEFYIFSTDDRGNPITSSRESIVPVGNVLVDQGEHFRRGIVQTLEEMGVETGASYNSSGPGQHKIILRPDRAMITADKVVTLKFVVRTIANRYGLHASFMPKPLNSLPGSGLHWQLSLHSGDDSCFNPAQSMPGSPESESFIGGLLAHARGSAAITNPTVNSYKRLVPGDLTPTYVSWSEYTRNSVLRVPARGGQENYVEVRNPDPACNPYLALAVLLRAGLSGIKNQLQLPPMVSGNIFQMDSEHREALQVASFPRNLEEALQELAADQLVRDTLGDYLCQWFIDAKTQEWERFQSFVHPWELKEYLPAL